jgi:TonB family protein
MRRTCLVLILFVSLTSLERRERALAIGAHGIPAQEQTNIEFGLALYPNATYLPEATERLRTAKAPSWLLASVYHSDDSIRDIAKYFQQQSKTLNKAPTHPIVKSLLRSNWEMWKGPVFGTSTVFGVGDELLKRGSNEKAETSFGIILHDDSLVRVHLMSPHPSSTDNNKLVPGTMITLIKERLPEDTKGDVNQNSVQEKVYSGRDVTQKILIKSKPNPEYSRKDLFGTVVLRAVFAASGKVTTIKVVTGPPDLTEAAIQAALKISFEPAIKDGRYVSMWLQLEYDFDK